LTGFGKKLHNLISLGTFPLEPASFLATCQSQFAWVCQKLRTQLTEYDSQNQYYDKSDKKTTLRCTPV